MLISVAFRVREQILLLLNVSMTYGVYQGFMMPINYQAGYKVLKNNA